MWPIFNDPKWPTFKRPLTRLPSPAAAAQLSAQHHSQQRLHDFDILGVF